MGAGPGARFDLRSGTPFDTLLSLMQFGDTQMSGTVGLFGNVRSVQSPSHL